LAGPLDRPRRAVALARPAVEADRTGEAVAGRRREPRVPPAEAEADGEDARSAGRAEVLDRRAHVGLDPVLGRLRDVLHVREVVATLAHAGGPAEVVDRDGGDPALGEAKRELLVEAVEPADVRQDDDTRAARVVGCR